MLGTVNQSQVHNCKIIGPGRGLWGEELTVVILLNGYADKLSSIYVYTQRFVLLSTLVRERNDCPYIF